MLHVCGVTAKTFTLIFLYYLKMWQMCGDKEFLSFISGKMEWESPPSIFVTRNPNWSQRSSTGTGCVKGRYQHPKYVLPKVSCIVLLSNKIYDLVVFSSCWSVYDLRKVLLGKEILILLGNSNVNQKNLISGIRLMYKIVTLDIKREQHNFFEFLKYWPSSHDFNKLVIKDKMHAYFFLKFSFVI